MRVALVHYWLVTLRGGEKVLRALCDLFPQADIFTHVYDEAGTGGVFSGHQVQTSFIQKLPLARRRYKDYLPLMPAALKRLDLSGYDLIISSESGPAKGVCVPVGAKHICYCHTPMRYAWDLYDAYRASAPWPKRLLMPAVMSYMRRRDVVSARGVDRFVANSNFVAERIKRIYRRNAEVIHPPVAVDDFLLAEQHDDFYLVVGQHVPYKRTDLAVEAFNASGRRLVVIGGGDQLSLLRRMAHDNVEILGRQSAQVIRNYYSRCRALIFPGVEDFGIVPVEAMASGRPVIAMGRGGATESVVDGVTGLFFHEQTAASLNDAVERFEALPTFDSRVITGQARLFDETLFKERFGRLVKSVMAQQG